MRLPGVVVSEVSMRKKGGISGTRRSVLVLGSVLRERTTLMAALKPQKLAESRFEAYPYLITSTYDRSRSAPPATRMTLVSLASAEYVSWSMAVLLSSNVFTATTVGRALF